MKLSQYKAVICEGSAENAIIDILLDCHKLIFDRSELIEEAVLRTRSATSFESRYLRKGFKSKITIIRILDSRNENFKISKAYANKIDIINVITAPEIEMLIILNENKYNEYKKSGKKPSIFCKDILKFKNVKSYDFVYNYFQNPEDLIQSIKEYTRISKIKANEYTLNDLLK